MVVLVDGEAKLGTGVAGEGVGATVDGAGVAVVAVEGRGASVVGAEVGLDGVAPAGVGRLVFESVILLRRRCVV